MLLECSFNKEVKLQIFTRRVVLHLFALIAVGCYTTMKCLFLLTFLLKFKAQLGPICMFFS